MDNMSKQSGHILLLDAALQAIPYGFCVWSPAFELVLWNQHYLDIYGFSPRRMYKGMSLEEIVTMSAEIGNHPDQSPAEFLGNYKSELLANRSGLRSKVRELIAGGRILETAHVYSPGLGWVVTHEDVTDAIASTEIVQRRKLDLERQNLRFDAAVNNISQGLSMHDAQGRLVITNEPYQRIYNLPQHLLLPGTELDAILDYLCSAGMTTQDGDFEAYRRWRKALISKREYGKAFHQFAGRTILMQSHPMKDGGWVSTHEDITEQRQQEERIRHMARHDALTGLPNRVQFIEALEATEAAIARGECIAVLYVDLDHFKQVNDSLGHSIGDKLLQHVASRLKTATREGDLLARLGGDEFALLLRGGVSPADAAGVSERIVTAIGRPFLVDEHHLVIGASVGIALAPADGDAGETLMKNADLALYKAKTDGRSTYHFFETGMDAAIQKRRAIEAGLRLALGRDEFRLVFQPLVGLAENRITCFEALLRWDPPGRTTVSPADFIPIAEETGLIVSIGEWVLREACRTAASWPDNVRVAVNLSPAQFRSKHLYDTVMGALSESGLDPCRLELEITESLLLTDNEPTLRLLHTLRAVGIRISMDDFGTGYSSLSYLRSFPFDKIKIDRSFMRDLKTRSDSLAIVQAVIGLGHSLGMSTTAEGIETTEQLDAVRALGCNEVQGFLFSPPVAASTAADLLATDLLAGTKPEARAQLLRRA
jgi:diguanylate cyclase (GGDEF)-like protein